jgi:hypothetical protein
VGDRKFLTNHTRVLVAIAATPGIRLRDIALRLGLTERATHRIVSDLEADGYLTRHKVGARNFYEIHPDQPLDDRQSPGLTIGDLLRLLVTHTHRDTDRAA